MKRIGIIGGMGPESTIDYYRELIDAFKNEKGDMNYPEIVIFSINFSRFLLLLKEKKYDELSDFLIEKIKVLKDAGAEFAALSANTPHFLFDRLNEKSPVPLISIVEATCKEAISKGMKRPGLMGTGFTMNSTFYQDVFSRNGLEIVIPGKKDREFIHHKLFTEIELGIFKNETRKDLEEIIDRMVKEDRIDSIILGCTELPIILTEEAYSGIPVLNTTRIHVREIVGYCLK
jgi:aspartate racemase